MSNNNNQPITIDNPVKIDRIEASKTKDGSPQISFYSGALEYPVLNLRPFGYGLLFNVGIDPNTIQPGQAHYCQFWASWEASERINGKGNPYKNVTELHPISSPAEAETLELLRQIKDLLLYQADQQPGGREALRQWYKAKGEGER